MQQEIQKNSRGELKVSSVPGKYQEKMQAAFEKEWATWVKYEAATIIPPEKVKRTDEKAILESRAAWTDKADKNDTNLSQPTCRVVGKGVQEDYDDKLRREIADDIDTHGAHDLLYGGDSTTLYFSLGRDWCFPSRRTHREGALLSSADEHGQGLLAP